MAPHPQGLVMIDTTQRRGVRPDIVPISNRDGHDHEWDEPEAIEEASLQNLLSDAEDQEDQED